MTFKDFEKKLEQIEFESLTVVSSVLDLVVEAATELKSTLKEKARGVDNESATE